MDNEISNEFNLDDEYAPRLADEINFGERKEEINYIILSIPTSIPGEVNNTLIEDTEEAVNSINELIENNTVPGIRLVGRGTAYNTTLAEIMYGLNFSTRNIYRSKIGELSQSFTDMDKQLRILLSDQ